ncbi:ABC transporter permease [Cellulosilyticum sp. I15G10I2]|uniref:ABC transporter permease n=1 Tax=Cellulosilyticum sp. I15G10I2 TaxID=1892843 RepID=UPI00085C6CFD|nr:FtsX-like permease family protein [Cellulosilyticum sp. I15G10I2]
MQLYHIVLNNLRRRKAKMLFVLLGLIIGIATIVSVYGVVETMKTEMTRQVTEFGVNVVITPDSGGLTFSYGGITLPEIMYDVNELTSEDLDKINGLPSKEMVRVIAPKLIGMEMLETGQKVTVVGANLQEEFTVKPWLRIDTSEPMSEVNRLDGEASSNEILENKAIDNAEKKEMDYEAIDLTREDITQLNLSDQEIIIGSVLAKSLGVSSGDTITIAGSELEVYATLLESGTIQDQQLFMNLPAAQSLLERPDKITVIEMAVDYFLGSEEALLTEIKEELPHTNVTSLRQETLRQDEMLTRLVRFGTAISILVLLVGMFVVGLTMLSSVRERTREIGIFRALGFRRKHITQMIIMEGTIISFIGGVIGFIMGMFIARYASPLFIGAEMQVAWRLDLLLIALGTSVIIGLISSLYPAYQAAKLDPVEALRFI